MGTLWCAKFPVLPVQPAAAPIKLTIVVPYYENPEFFARQIDGWRQLPADLRADLSAVIVDDGSPTSPAQLPDDLPFPIRLFRIEKDVRWNWLAARNIGMQYAPEGWCLLTDMDHVAPEATLRAIVWGTHDPLTVYAFSRNEHTGESIAPHSASFLMTRAVFWRIGGYDEALSGHYGTDGEYRRRLAQRAPLVVLTVPLVRHQFVADSSTTQYLRKQPKDAAVRSIVAARGAGWTPKVLSFPYHEVTA